MTGAPCPNEDGNELRHPDAMFCTPCARRLPHRLRRAMFRVNHGPDRTPQGDRDTLRAEVFQRCQHWFTSHPAGEPTRSMRGSR